MNMQLMKDRLKSARNAFLTSKTEDELKTFRQLIRYLQHKIKEAEVGELPEEELV